MLSRLSKYPRSPRHCVWRFSVNRTVGRSADGVVLCLAPAADCGAKSLTFRFLVMVVVEVFKVFAQDLARCSVLWNRTLTLESLVVVPAEVFMVFLPDMVPDSVLWNRTLVVVLLVLVTVYDRACRSKLWNRPQTFLSLVVEICKVFSQNRFQRRFLELNMSMEVQFPVHVDDGRLLGSVPGQSSTARRGAHLHELLPEDVVDEELQERMDAHELWLERIRSVVLFSQRSKLCDEGGRGRARALRTLASPSSSGSGLARCASSSRTRRRRTPCASAGLSSKLFPSTPLHGGEFVGGPLSSLTTIPRLRTCLWCSRLRNLPCSSRMRSKQPRRHSLNDGIMRAAAVLVGERRALVFRYGNLGMVLLFMVWFSCVHCRVGCSHGDVVVSRRTLWNFTSC